MDNKLNKVVAYDIGLPRTKSHNSSIICSLMANEKWHILTCTSLMNTNRDRVVVYDMNLPLKKINHP